MATGPYLSPAPPRILAHRGLATSAVENTAPAFHAAVAAGVTFIETDAHATADGVAVLWHDPDLQRLDGSRDRISELSWADLSKRSYDGTHIQRLADALTEFPSTKFNIDFKVESVLEPGLAAIADAGATDRVLVASFDDGRRKRAAKLLPGIATSAGSAAIAQIVFNRFWSGHTRWRRIVEHALDGAAALQIPERQFGLRVLTPALIELAHELGVEVHVWTINEPQEMRRLLDMGVDGLVTDRCDLGIQVIAERPARAGGTQ